MSSEAVRPRVPAPRAERPAPLMICMRDAAARMGGRTLWSGVELDVHAGEFVAVLGPNGAGKSTLVKMVLGMLVPAAGDIRVLGEAPGRTGDRVGYLPQRRSKRVCRCVWLPRTTVRQSRRSS
jgi:zinc/manganese transport system ATP-binding protein